MSLLNSIDRPHVLTAIETWDAAGGGNYMLVRGGVSTHVLLHHGREYDAAAIAGIAHGLATGRTLTAADIPGGSAAASKALVRGSASTSVTTRRPVAERVPGTRSTTPRTPRARPRREPPRRAAPASPRATGSSTTCARRCFIAMPATGICDQCD